MNAKSIHGVRDPQHQKMFEIYLEHPHLKGVRIRYRSRPLERSFPEKGALGRHPALLYIENPPACSGAPQA